MSLQIKSNKEILAEIEIRRINGNFEEDVLREMAVVRFDVEQRIASSLAVPAQMINTGWGGNYNDSMSYHVRQLAEHFQSLKISVETVLVEALNPLFNIVNLTAKYLTSTGIKRFWYSLRMEYEQKLRAYFSNAKREFREIFA